MKKVSAFLVGVFIMFGAIAVKAQIEVKDYFVGKWEVLIEGTPQGDSKMLLALERKDGKLTGTVTSPGQPASPIKRVEEKEKSTTIYFSSTGYDVYLLLEKKDDNTVTGNLMDMFDAKGKRVIEEVKK